MELSTWIVNCFTTESHCTNYSLIVMQIITKPRIDTVQEIGHGAPQCECEANGKNEGLESGTRDDTGKERGSTLHEILAFVVLRRPTVSLHIWL